MRLFPLAATACLAMTAFAWPPAAAHAEDAVSPSAAGCAETAVQFEAIIDDDAFVESGKPLRLQAMIDRAEQRCVLGGTAPFARIGRILGDDPAG